MLRFNFLLVLMVVGQVISLNDRPKILRNNPLELKLIGKLLREKPELAKIDPTFFQDRSNQYGSKTLISKFVYAILIGQLTKMSNFPTLVVKNISEKCHNDSQAYFNAYLLLANWANQMFESTGRLPVGLFNSGNVHAKGLFDQCVNVQANWTSTSFTGKYCTVFLDSEPVMPEELADETAKGSMQRVNWLKFFENLDWFYNGPALKQSKVRNVDRKSTYLTNVDFCIPSSCSVEDFRYAVAQLIGSRAIEITTLEGNRSFTSIVAVTDEKFCFTKEQINATPQFNSADIAVILMLSFLGILILLATLREFWNTCNNRPVQSDKDGLFLKVLHCFSMITNGRNLLSTKSAVVENLACLNGIRVLSTAWIVLLHSYFIIIISPVYNIATFIEDALTWQVHGILNASMAVDTFFLMSALLVTYSLMRDLDRNKGRFNIALFYLHRYLRLTPVYAVILGFVATLLVYIGSGPYWPVVHDISEGCRSNWWNNLLYINNYIRTHPKECMGETWYLACDMQMFFLSPLFIYPLWKWWKIGVIWSTCHIIICICGTIAIYVFWDLPPTGFFTREGAEKPHYFDDYYVQMWARSPPYILGILLGWILNCTKKNKVEMSKFVVATGWTLTSLIILAVSYGMVPYLNPVEVPEIKDSVRISYGSLHRLAWAVSIAWIIFACIQGYGGFVNRFLSWKIFIPLARLTYVVYLIHLIHLFVFHLSIRMPYYYTKYTHTEHYFGTILMTFLMAFVICLTVEVPFLNLERVLLPSRTRKPDAVVDIQQEL